MLWSGFCSYLGIRVFLVQLKFQLKNTYLTWFTYIYSSLFVLSKWIHNANICMGVVRRLSRPPGSTGGTFWREPGWRRLAIFHNDKKSDYPRSSHQHKITKPPHVCQPLDFQTLLEQTKGHLFCLFFPHPPPPFPPMKCGRVHCKETTVFLVG